MPKAWSFDSPNYLEVTAARQEWIRKVLGGIQQKVELHSALDAGCGVGYFAEYLAKQNFYVVAFDGRAANVEEAARRFPEIEFHVGNVEDSRIRELGVFDLVLCFGLLYHLENPFQSIRNLHALTGKVLIIESMCVPGNLPNLLLREESISESQGLRYVSFYPTENALVKMCYQSGFPFVYGTTFKPTHKDFAVSLRRHRARTVIVASKIPIELPILERLSEPQTFADPWRKTSFLISQFMIRSWRFLKKPVPEKARTVRSRVKRFRSQFIPFVPIPVLLPCGFWWLAWDDDVSNGIFLGTFEQGEQNFVQKFLKPGMIVLDIGAHNGLYTLLALKKVGGNGRVIAFEPSLRERKRLNLHLKLNNCKNISVESSALASCEGETNLFVVEGQQTGHNSLQPPKVTAQTHLMPVRTTSLDQYLFHEYINFVDFIKIDVEGAELEVLKGSQNLLSRKPRPIILSEVQDVRTESFGYNAQEILFFLRERDYYWFKILSDGRLSRLANASDLRSWNGYNFVAVPIERMSEIQEMLDT